MIIDWGMVPANRRYETSSPSTYMFTDVGPGAGGPSPPPSGASGGQIVNIGGAMAGRGIINICLSLLVGLKFWER